MEFKYREESLCSYIEKLAEKSPCPSGGSAAVLVVALANSLVCMSANYTVTSNLVDAESKEKAKEICSWITPVPGGIGLPQQ
ncbi:MAG: cyclodeaminase/cyclohydrolase family protein [Candidatus Ratteibacteria bacterium]